MPQNVTTTELEYIFNIHNYFLTVLSADECKKFLCTVSSFQNFEIPPHKLFFFFPTFKAFPLPPTINNSSLIGEEHLLEQPEEPSHNQEIMTKELQFNEFISYIGMQNDDYLRPGTVPLLTAMQKDVFERLRNTLCKYSTRKNLETVLEEDKEFASALEEAESISNQFQNKVVVTSYNNLPYIIDFVTPILESNSLMNDSESFQEHIQKHYQRQVQHSWQPLIKAKLAYGVDEESSPKTNSLRHHIEKYLQSLPAVQNELFMEDETVEQLQRTSYMDGTFLLPEFIVESSLNGYVMYMAKVALFVAKHIKSCLKHFTLLQTLETKINYSFKNKLLLRTALTTPSYVNQKQRYISSNQRLEFLGDCVLELIVTNYLFETFKERPEGHLSKKRSILVRNAALAEVGRALDLAIFALPKQNDFDIKLQADLLEALIGAIFMDSEFSHVGTFVHDFIIKNKIKDEETPVHYRYHTFES